MADDLLNEQLAYYRARAGEYDDWFYRRGRYDWGAELNQLWFNEVELVRRELRAAGHFNTALELACGTGLWTEQLLAICDDITAVDGSPEVIEINRAKLNSPRVHYVQADLFAWEPEREFDLVACCFWLSHVPVEKLDTFLDKVRRATRPGGKLFIVDSLNESTSMAKNHDRPAVETGVRVRRLNDGREFRVVKVYHEPAAFAARLARHGFATDMRASGAHFLYGIGTRK